MHVNEFSVERKLFVSGMLCCILTYTLVKKLSNLKSHFRNISHNIDFKERNLQVNCGMIGGVSSSRSSTPPAIG